jgi:hypothetical protein
MQSRHVSHAALSSLVAGVCAGVIYLIISALVGTGGRVGTGGITGSDLVIAVAISLCTLVVSFAITVIISGFVRALRR